MFTLYYHDIYYPDIYYHDIVYVFHAIKSTDQRENYCIQSNNTASSGACRILGCGVGVMHVVRLNCMN